MRLIRRSILNYIGVLAAGVVGVVTVPLLWNGLGTENYGLWISAATVAGILGALDLGLEWTTIRVVASSSGGNSPFLNAAFTVCVGLAGLQATATLASGILLRGWLHLSPESWSVSTLVFALAGAMLFGNQLWRFSNSVLEGMQRFDLSNLVVVVGAVLRLVGLVWLVRLHCGVVEIAACQAAVSLVTAAGGFILAAARNGFMPRFARLAALREHLRFGILSQGNALLTRVLWEGGTVLVSAIGGSAAVPAYYAGRRFPASLSFLHDRVGGVVFPMASEHEQKKDPAATTEILIAATRWILILASPILVVLVVFAEPLLQIWLGRITEGSVAVLRLTAVAVFCDAAGSAALHVLWGRGDVAVVFRVLLVWALAGLGLSVPLVLRMGATGAAVGNLISLLGVAACVLLLGCRAISTRWTAVLRAALRGLAVPAVLCAGSSLAVVYLWTPATWFSLILAVLVAAVVYLVSLYLLGADQVEKSLVAGLFPSRSSVKK